MGHQIMCKNLVLWDSDPLRNRNLIFIPAFLKSSFVPCLSEGGGAGSCLQVLHEGAAPRLVWGCHSAPRSAQGGFQHPRISHEWSNPFCRSTSWPRGVGSASFPVFLVLTSWPWACRGACRAKLQAGGSAGELLLAGLGAGSPARPGKQCNPYGCSWGAEHLAKGTTCLPDLFWSVRQGHQLIPLEHFSLVALGFSNVKL